MDSELFWSLLVGHMLRVRLALLMEYAAKMSAAMMMRITKKMAPNVPASTVIVLMLAESSRITSDSVVSPDNNLLNAQYIIING